MKKYIVGEIAVILFVVVGVDYFSWVICWIPFLVYNFLFLGRIARFTIRE